MIEEGSACRKGCKHIDLSFEVAPVKRHSERDRFGTMAGRPQSLHHPREANKNEEHEQIPTDRIGGSFEGQPSTWKVKKTNGKQNNKEYT